MVAIPNHTHGTKLHPVGSKFRKVTRTGWWAEYTQRHKDEGLYGTDDGLRLRADCTIQSICKLTDLPYEEVAQKALASRWFHPFAGGNLTMILEKMGYAWSLKQMTHDEALEVSRLTGARFVCRGFHSENRCGHAWVIVDGKSFNEFDYARRCTMLDIFQVRDALTGKLL